MDQTNGHQPTMYTTTHQMIQAMTFLSPSWRSRKNNLCKGHLTIPKESPAESPGKKIMWERLLNYTWKAKYPIFKAIVGF